MKITYNNYTFEVGRVVTGVLKETLEVLKANLISRVASVTPDTSPQQFFVQCGGVLDSGGSYTMSILGQVGEGNMP